MGTQVNVALMTADPALAAAVSSAFQSNGHALAEPLLRDARDLMAHLSRAPVPIVLVDLDPQPQEALRSLERVVARFPHTRFVALSHTLESDLLLEAMQNGFRRVVVKQSIATELHAVLDRLTVTADHSGHGSRGDVLTILSASGGCGATTLAVNIADELSTLQKQPALLVDLDCAYGAVASYLGIHPRYGADQVLNYTGPIDGQLIQSTATRHNDRIHVLASPASVNFGNPEPLHFERLETALESARKAYTTTIVDAPRVPIDAAAALVTGSTATLLVLQLTVKDLRLARSMLDAISGRGCDTSSVIPVANRHAKKQMIGLDEASKALGGVQVLAIRNDYWPAIQGMNYGQPLSEAGPRSTIRKDLQDLVAKLREKKPAAIPS
jgi:pilus assembly protein CpaE